MVSDKFEQTTNDGMNLLRSVIGISPFVAAAWAGTDKLRSNQAINVPLAKSTTMQTLGRQMGLSAKDLSLKNKVSDFDTAKKSLEQIRIHLDKAESLQEVFKSAERRNGLLQALSITLDDPNLGIDDTKRMMMKQQLMEAAHISTPQHEEITRDILKAISDSSDNSVVAKFAQLRSQFERVGATLNAPTIEIPKSGVSFSHIDAATLNSREKNYLQTIRNALGGVEGDYDVRVAQYQEFNSDFRVAQIFRKGQNGDRFKTNIPLTNNTYYRSGQSGRTLYAMPKIMADLQLGGQAAEKNLSTKQLVSQMTRTPEFFVKEFSNRASSGFVDFSDYNSWMVGHMTGVERIAGSNQAFSAHARFQAEAKMNTVGLFNIEKLSSEQQRKAVASMSSKYSNILNAGIGSKRLLSRSEDGLMGSLGIQKGSFFEALQRAYGTNIDRSIVPLTLREHQIVGKPGMFVGSSYKIGKSGLAGGSIFKAALDVAQSTDHEAIRAALKQITPFGELVSGGLGAVTLLDVSKTGRLSQGLGGQGIAYTGRSQLVETPHQFAVLDPKSHGYLESDLLKRIRESGSQGLVLSKEELAANPYLGETSNGSKFLSFHDRMESMHLSLGEVTEDNAAGGVRKTVSIIGRNTKELDIFKVFGLSFKGNVQTTSSVLGQFDSNVQAPLKSALKSLGIDERSVIASSSDMMSKGAIGFINQIAGGTRLVSAGGITLDELRDRASSIAGGANQILDIHRDPVKPLEVEYKALAHYAQSAMELMHMRGVDPSHMGLVMSGVYHGAEGSSDKYGLKKQSIETLAEMLWKNDPAKLKLFKESINLGVTIGYDVFQLGESVNDWGRGRAGVEPRFAKTLHERLLGFGFKVDEASNVVANLYKNKIGLDKHFELASHLLNMQNYTSGATTAKDFISNKSTRLTFNDLIGKIIDPDNKTNTLSDYLRRTPGGLIVDMTTAPAAIARASKEVFGQGELFLPGAEAFEASKGAVIKQQGGSAAVEGELGQLIDSFQSRILGLHQNSTEAIKSLEEWKGKSNNLFLRVFEQLSSGKIKGGISPTTGMYDLTKGTGLSNSRMLERAEDVFFKSRGQAVFQTAESFASQLHDMKGTISEDDMARKARMFFTSMEKGSVGNRYLGLAGIGGRHPMMTTGNVYFTQTFRHLEEVSTLGGEDAFFNKIKASEAGRNMLQSHFDTIDVKSFAHLSTFNKSQQKSFFKDFVKNISQFTSGQSSDMLFVPSLKTKQGDIGIGVQAFMDSDGDHALHFLFDSPTANSVMKKIRTSGDMYALQDFQLRAFFNSMTDQTKGALNSMRDKALVKGALSVEDKIFQDVSKEVGLAMQTGPLDSSLRGIHEAFMMYEDDPLQKGFGRMLLGNIQENFVIKSKKLPSYENLGGQVQAAAKQLTTTGDISDMRNLLNRLFEGQDIAGPGMRISGQLELEAGASSTLKQQFDKFFGNKNFDITYSLNDFLDRAERVVQRGLTERTIDKTTGQWAAAFAQDSYSTMSEMRAGQTFGSASMEGFIGKSFGAKAEVAMDIVRQGFNNIDSHMTGKLALAAVASAALFGMMSNGVSPEPIIMPGENPNSSVANLIRSGNLFNNVESDISPEEIAPVLNQYDRMAPINSNTTYATRPNSYQIRGEVSSNAGLSGFSSYFSQLTNGAGRGNLTINDQRRPITTNYVDRLLGEY